MNDGMLSQDEIDALLNIGNDDNEDTKSGNAEEVNLENYLTGLERDALGEIGNISFGSSATTLSTLLNHKVEITTPEVSVVKKPGLDEEFPFDHVSLRVNYIEGFTGSNLFVVKAEDAAIISDIMLGGDGSNPEKDLSEIHLSAVQEAMNQMMGASATSMSTVFDKKIDISPPSVQYENIEQATELKGDSDHEIFVKVSFQIIVGDLIDSNIMQLIPLSFAKELVGMLLHTPSNEKGPEQMTTRDQIAKTETSEKPMESEQPAMKHTEDQDSATTQYIGDSVQQNANVQQASFSTFDQVGLNRSEQRNLDMLLDIPLKVTVELGRTKRTIQDILELSSGSIVELDKLAGEPVDVLVNEKLIAKGEVVVIDENFGVRVSDIVSQTDRLLNLK
ncbi:flagellar motor switch phosphatase FliY [Virgibacillus sp. W0181]|uniref:flagellar motor switch phosphatase FliY n=1 Tax=Virgibacillus sp. W0181 TaxID=3391581 RepID=UPI003F44CEA0